MKRVMIIGCGGAGKSTLARKLGEKTGLPVVHLDQIWWAPGNWQHIEKPEFDEKLAVELEKPRWILDGNFNRTIEARLEACDTVIYLDYPRLVCIKNWLGRVIKNWGRHRSDMTEGCTEWFDPEFVKWIWNFNKNNRARYYELLNNAGDKKVVILKSRRQAQKFLDSL
jgi:adenylate kinase family enzyme